MDFLAEHWFIEAIILIASSTLAAVLACWFVEQFNKD
jgi:hypothetical protein